jgi:hypothetical protein
VPDHRAQEPQDPGPQPDQNPKESYEHQSPHHLPSEEPTPYYIRRKGSLYNIYGPDGRLFKTYKSAALVGPRWEELTHTPWPFEGSAYEPGLRLWQMGLITRDQVGKTKIRPVADWSPAPPAPKPQVDWKLPDQGLKQQSLFDAQPPSAPPDSPSQAEIRVEIRAGLPKPTLDLKEHEKQLARLRKEPRLLFEPPMRQALEREIEYHRPDAAWAKHLLDLLHRFENRVSGTEPSGENEPPLPNILDVYRNPLLALHPDQDGLRAMLQEEANDSGLLAEFARKLDRILLHWQEQPERLRGLLMKQADVVRRGGALHIDPLVGGPCRYRSWLILRNRERNELRAALIDSETVLVQHLKWQEVRLARV